MKEKALVGVLLICLVLGAVSVSCVNGIVSAEDSVDKTKEQKLSVTKYPGDVSAYKWDNYIHFLKIKECPEKGTTAKDPNADLIACSNVGFVEYTFPIDIPEGANIEEVKFAAEICSEIVLCSNEEHKSDITISINGHEVETWTSYTNPCGKGYNCPGSGWETEYGYLKEWITQNPLILNSIKSSGKAIIRHEVKPNAENKCGISIWGKYSGTRTTNPTLYILYSPSPKELTFDIINSVSTKIDALKRKNVDTSVIEQALSKAKDSYEREKYDEAYELAQNAQKMADDAYETAGHIESAQSEIEVAKSISADVTEAENKLKDAKDALNKGNYEYARSWADEASELAKHASAGSVKIIDLKALATKYDQRTVVVSGTIRDIKTVYGKGYTFALDDGSGMISVVYEGGLGDIQEGDKVTVSGAFQASTGTVAADTVQKSGVGGVPGFELIFAIAGLLAVAYLIRRRRSA